MFKKILTFFAAMYMAVSFAAVDVNKANAAELDSIKGIGPSISGKIMDERKKGEFKNWDDFIQRVKGIGEGNAAKFSAEGMTVGGSSFKGATAVPSGVKKNDKPAAPVTTAPVATSTAKDEKKDVKAEAKSNTEKSTKADVKPTAKDAKAEVKPELKVDAAKLPASAAKK